MFLRRTEAEGSGRRRDRSLQDSLPVLTISDKDKLVLPAYRQQAAHKLAAVIIDLEYYLGVGRVFIP
jgi:hypothetical protein